MALMDFELGDIGNLFRGIRESITGEKITDPAEMAKISYQLSQLEQAANQGQISTNKIEAAHKSLFVAGWRPFIGWVCGTALAYAYIGHPIIEWGVSIFNITHMVVIDGAATEQIVEAPKIDSDTLYQLVLALLGMATLRTYEKKENVSREK